MSLYRPVEYSVSDKLEISCPSIASVCPPRMVSVGKLKDSQMTWESASYRTKFPESSMEAAAAAAEPLVFAISFSFPCSILRTSFPSPVSSSVELMEVIGGSSLFAVHTTVVVLLSTNQIPTLKPVSCV
ncbi:hypothetical protein CsSME_00018363 [Camellia sinensis var. sinensis]